MSSTTRIRAVALAAHRSAPFAVAPHSGDELDDVDRLRDVVVEPRREEPLAVAVHRLCREGEHGHLRRPFALAKAPERLATVDVRQLDVHEDEVGHVLVRQLDCVLTRGRLESAVAACLEDVSEQLHVLLVVLDDEDELVGQRSAHPPGSVNTKVLPLPSSLSTQIRPPCSSTSRFESARPRPVPSAAPRPPPSVGTPRRSVRDPPARYQARCR